MSEQETFPPPARPEAELPPAAASEPGLVELLGGRRGALDASLPAVGFGIGWLAGGQDLRWAIAGAVAVGVIVAAWRLLRRHQPRAAVLGLTGVLVGALIAARTGRPEDFFLLQLLSNVVSALIWATSIWLRRPLLGMIVAALLRQGKTWRADPVLRQAYAAASWWWTATFVLRTVVFTVLWASGAVLGLTIARVVLSWPLVASCIALSWRTMRLRLRRAEHPGIRHPQSPEVEPEPTEPEPEPTSARQACASAHPTRR